MVSAGKPVPESVFEGRVHGVFPSVLGYNEWLGTHVSREAIHGNSCFPHGTRGQMVDLELLKPDGVLGSQQWRCYGGHGL